MVIDENVKSKIEDCYPYIEECEKCGCKNKVFTQSDRNPEYYTEVLVKCDNCDNYVQFMLPVN